MIITIDTEKIEQMRLEADKILFEPEADELIKTLLELKESLEQVEEDMKARIEKKALELNPDFASIEGDNARVVYSFTGSNYSVENPEVVDRQFVKVREAITVDSEKVNAHLEKEGKLPEGIVINPKRRKIITFKRSRL